MVEVQCRIGVIFVILNHLKAKISTGGTVRRAGRYQRWLRAPSGGVETKEFSPGRLDVGLAAAEAGFRFRADQSRGRRMLGTYAAPEAAAAAEAAAESCDGGIDPARVLLIWVVR